MTGVNIAYIIFGTIASLFACLYSVSQYVKYQRQKWLNEVENTQSLSLIIKFLDKQFPNWRNP